MTRWTDDPINSLGPRLDEHFAEDEGLKNGENVFAVGQHAVKHAVIHGVVLRQPLPALQNVRRDIDILAQFLQRVPAQEEAVEECCFLLRFGELELRSRHKLRNPNSILTRKNSGAPVKFFPCAPGRKHNDKPVVKSPANVHAGLEAIPGNRSARLEVARGSLRRGQLQISLPPGKIKTWL